MKNVVTALATLGLGLALTVSCTSAGTDSGGNSEPLGVTTQALTTAAGPIPTGLPQKVMVGLFENTDETWMTNSGVSWDARYRYFTYGWANNFGHSQTRDGAWGRKYLDDCHARGFLPVVEFYQVNGMAPGFDESQFLAKTQDVTKMTEYFGDFKLLMQRVKDFDKPVLILVETDGFGLLQKQSNDDPNTYAAVAATGIPELAGLPNTVAGWGLAFLELRKQVGATKAILGLHVSSWGGGRTIDYDDYTDLLQPAVDNMYNFLAPLGIASNITGARYDVLVATPLDRDSAYLNRWWSMNDSDPINSKSFNRYAEWLRLWNIKTDLRWIVWQIPIGNANHLNIPEDGTTVYSGYKDNRVEYFFDSGTTTTAHVEKFAASGVIGLLFGKGDTGQSTYQTDGDYLKNKANSFILAGGVPLSSTPLSPVGPFTPAPTDSAQYHFEQDAQGWSGSDPTVTGVASSTTQMYAGTRSLAVNLSFSGAGDSTAVRVSSPSVPAGAKVTFRLWVPINNGIDWVQTYAQEGASTWRWTGGTQRKSYNLSEAGWNTLEVTVPSTWSPLASMGLEFHGAKTWTGTVYIDSVSW